MPRGSGRFWEDQGGCGFCPTPLIEWQCFFYLLLFFFMLMCRRSGGGGTKSHTPPPAISRASLSRSPHHGGRGRRGVYCIMDVCDSVLMGLEDPARVLIIIDPSETGRGGGLLHTGML